MSASDLGDNHPHLITRLHTSGLAPIVLGLLAILCVIVEYEVLRYGWSGHESLMIGIIFLLLPGTAIGLTISGMALGIAG